MRCGYLPLKFLPSSDEKAVFFIFNRVCILLHIFLYDCQLMSFKHDCPSVFQSHQRKQKRHYFPLRVRDKIRKLLWVSPAPSRVQFSPTSCVSCCVCNTLSYSPRVHLVLMIGLSKFHVVCWTDLFQSKLVANFFLIF